MAQITDGVRSILSIPWVYNLWGLLIGARKARTDFIANYLKAKSGNRVFDIGCGTGKMIEWMPKWVEYTGFDLSLPYILAAREKYGDLGTFLQADVGSAPDVEAGTQDIAIATGVLHHLEDDEAEELFKLAHRVLRKGGRLITSDPVYVEDQSGLARFIISRDRGRNVRDYDGYVSLANRVFDDVETDVRHDRLRIPYTHLLLTCRKNSPIR